MTKTFPPELRRCLPRAAAVGALVGFLTGLFGVGGGFLIVPALTVVSRPPAKALQRAFSVFVLAVAVFVLVRVAVA
ncbi:TSUP family transporter [Streptomyces sp. NPDC096310]|uniref:TSUP family transporter n=1 Tax=Streptomyces sp. NPDC096310 TaxID=3366082 RepID=UPI00382B1EE3